MRRLIKRSPSMGYKGMAKLAQEANRNIRANQETETMPASNPFIGDNFFNANPSKVLGTQHIERGRFAGSTMIIVDGTLSDIERIDATPVKVVDFYPQQNLTPESKQSLINEVFETEVKEERAAIVRKVRTGNAKKPAVPSGAGRESQDVYSFAEISEMYNKNISREELEAYYLTHPELNYKLLFDKFQYTKEDLIPKGFICWDEGKFVYYYTYVSGNVSIKLSHLKRDKDRMVEAMGQEQFDRQVKMLEDVRPKQKSLVGDEKLTILPHSNFAKEFKISELRLGIPELNSETNLFNAFKQWLRQLPPENFEKSTYIEIIDYYLDNKSIPESKASKDDKEQLAKDAKNAINIKQRTKEEGDSLFAKFLEEELLPEDQAKLSFIWNEKFNSIVEPDLTKIPVCFQISKTFKAGAPLILNPTQRQSAAFMMEKYSGLLAYGVGVGKSLGAITCVSQAFYGGFANKFLFVVPTNTYDKWIGEIQGYVDKETGVYMHGALPQFPAVQGVYNLNPLIVREKLKDYSKEDERTFESIEQAIIAVKKIESENLSEAQRKAITAIYPLNWNGMHAEYMEYTLNSKALRQKTYPEYVADYLKKEYDYLIYSLGTMKTFPKGTIFVTTEVGLQRLGVSEANKDELTARLYKILSQGDKAIGDRQSEKDIAALQLKIQQTVSSSLKNAKLNLEDLGIDWACFDEAHYYKKLFTSVKGDIKSEYGFEKDSEGDVSSFKRNKSKYELKSGAVPSARALSAFVVSHYIQSNNDNRNVISLTATPFTNSPLEVFSMLTLTNYKALQEIGLDNMVNFFDTFMKINYDIKYTPQKTVVKDVVLTGYNNLGQLRQVIYSLMDKKDEGANLKRPTKIIYPSLEKGIETTLPMTEEQNELMKEVKRYIQGDTEYELICQAAMQDEVDSTDFDGLDDETLIAEWERTTSKEFEGEREKLSDARRDAMIKAIKSQRTSGIEMSMGDLSDDESLGVRILKGLSMMRQVTLSPYLYYKACEKAQGGARNTPDYKDYINSSPKLKYVMGCIKSVIDYAQERGEKVSGQVIYMNAGVEYFPLIKEYLVKQLHLKESQVGIVSGSMSKGAKENVKQKFLNGDILVLIGSSTISVGVDLQNNASTLYNLYFDWNPTDAAQIEGRIWRQGNRFGYVRIVYPQCFNSADPVIFEYLNQKTLRINEIWNRSSSIQELDLRDFDPKKLQKELITDPEEKADWEILEESDHIQSQIIFFENKRESLNNALYAFRKVRDTKGKVIKWLNAISAKKMEIAKNKAVQEQKDRIYDIQEKFADDPEKMANEILKGAKTKYDYKLDPDGKFVPTVYSEEDLPKVYADIKKYNDLFYDLSWQDRADWQSLYDERLTIQDEFRNFRSNYKDMMVAQERILKPMGLDFATAANPVADFDAKLDDLREQLQAIDNSKPDRIKRITAEFKLHFKELKSVSDRIAEFVKDNDKYLSAQLMAAPVTHPVQLEKPVPEELLKPEIEEGFASRMLTSMPPAVPVIAEPENVTPEVIEPVAPPVITKPPFADEAPAMVPYLSDKDEILAALAQMASKTISYDQFYNWVHTLAGNWNIDINSEDFIKALDLKPGDAEYNTKQLKKFYKERGIPSRKEREQRHKQAVKQVKDDVTERNVANIEALALAADQESQKEIAAQETAVAEMPEAPIMDADVIKNAIKALNLAAKFAEPAEKKEIRQQIQALKTALEFA